LLRNELVEIWHDWSRLPSKLNDFRPNGFSVGINIGTYRKLHLGNQMVTWQETSRDPDRSRSWHQYVCYLKYDWIYTL